MLLARCEWIGARPSLAKYVAREEANYGLTYCGGQPEESIRHMLALDSGEGGASR